MQSREWVAMLPIWVLVALCSAVAVAVYFSLIALFLVGCCYCKLLDCGLGKYVTICVCPTLGFGDN